MEWAPIRTISHRRFVGLMAALGIALLIWGSGCPSLPNGQTDNDNTGNDNGNGDGTVTAKIVSFSTNFGVSALDPPISVLYTVTGTPASIAGFYVPVADSSPGAGTIGNRVILATNLPTGTNQAFSFTPAAAGVGYYRVGLIVMVGGVELTPTPESEGVIQVEGSPDPVFIQPAEASTLVWQGDEVAVSFDVGDPEGDVRWRLFYLTETDSRNNPPDQLGTQLKTGSGNVGSAMFSTAGLVAGEYEIGISATDSGYTVATTVANGDLDRIVTIPNSSQSGPIVRVVDTSEVQPPSVVFTAPGISGVSLFRAEAYTLQFTVTIGEPGATGVVELFYDTDNDEDNGFEATIVDDLAASATSYPLPTDLPAGTWYIGATVRTISGVSPATTFYAPGTIQIVRDPTLTVTAPSTPLPVAPSSPVTVTWTTTAPASAGNLDVFAKTVGSTGVATGSEIVILTAGPMTTTTATFTSTTSGLFEISVRLNLIDGTKITKTAPARVRITTVPRIVWVGSLVDENPPFKGAILGGVQYEDNAGSSLSAAGDLDDDNFDDFVIGARYGKPFFDNPSGIGAGEAYILYGGSGDDQLLGEYNLNSVGTAGLRGIALTGVPTAGSTADTDGLSDITLIPDADDDDKGELVFGFPKVDSAGGTGALEAAGQFLHGGVVILSSTNSVLEDPASGDTVINLGEVGQLFSNMTVETGGRTDILDDRLEFVEADPEANPPTQTGCAAGTDGINDTITGPSYGFIDDLAPPYWEQLGFTPVTTGDAPNVCNTRYDLADCTNTPDPFSELNAGSGYYPAAAVPLEPFGARIIGPSEEDGFGTSVTASTSLGDEGPGDLIISAPNRSALTTEVDGISSDISGAGIGYLADNRDLWETDPTFPGVPPKPHQYVMGLTSHCGGGRAASIGALRIAGDSNDQIENILGISDFNGDGRNDFVVGAPNAGGGQGRVYIAYRRQESIEGDFVLNKLNKAPTDAERLDGMLIVTDGTADALGSSLATDVDFNGDNVSDLVIGSPNASGGIGEVIIVFGDPGIVSGANGITLDALLSTSRTTDGGPVAVRITGNSRDTEGQFGFNVASTGDVDGDGKNDLLIAAPNATPRFDPDPNDRDDTLSDEGLDLDFDGIKDDASSSTGQPDGEIDTFDDLAEAGIVYVVLGLNRLDQVRTCSDSGKACESASDCLGGETCGSPDMTISIDQLGTSHLKGFMIVGRANGDRLGGGDAGDAEAGGKSEKLGRGRSRGLASAGDVDGDGRADILIGSVLADPRRDPNTGTGVANGGEAYLVYGSAAP